MSYSVSDIERVVNFKTWSDEKKIDTLLQMEAEQYPNLGTDSSKREWNEAYKTSSRIYNGIKKIDKKLGERLLIAQ
jgi:hypothetical protein|tara:strand:- start:607 stop:834 length:228 start_codon:yes stop_codon:yes gene_type:complete